MGLEVVQKILNLAIKEIKNSEEYWEDEERRQVLDTTINNLESIKLSLEIEPTKIRNKIETVIKQHTEEEVELDIWFHYDSIYPQCSIRSEKLTFEELFELAGKVTHEIYTEEFPYVVIASN